MKLSNLLDKLKRLTSPERLYKLNTWMVFVSLLFAVISFLLGLPAAVSNIFIANGLCFTIAAGANWLLVREKAVAQKRNTKTHD